MILNIVLVIIGLVLLLFGIKNKLKLWIVIGVILFVAGVISGIVDYKTAGTATGIDGGRVPMVVDNTMH